MKFKTWEIPRSVLEATERALRRGQHEIFVLWTASLKQTGLNCAVTRCVVPEQQPGVGEEGGVYVHIDGSELSRIQFDNYDQGELNIIQIHTHPGRSVRMSSLDRKWEVVNHIGALSIIVPSYCAGGMEGFIGVNVYERCEDDWRLWSDRENIERLKVL